MTKTTRQLSKRTLVQHHYMDASSWAYRIFEVYARINGDRLQMVMFGGLYIVTGYGGIMNSLPFKTGESDTEKGLLYDASVHLRFRGVIWTIRQEYYRCSSKELVVERGYSYHYKRISPKRAG